MLPVNCFIAPRVPHRKSTPTNRKIVARRLLIGSICCLPCLSVFGFPLYPFVLRTGFRNWNSPINAVLLSSGPSFCSSFGSHAPEEGNPRKQIEVSLRLWTVRGTQDTCRFFLCAAICLVLECANLRRISHLCDVYLLHLGGLFVQNFRFLPFLAVSGPFFNRKTRNLAA